jgi:hypothetical protein
MVWLVWLCCLMLFRIFLFSQYWAIFWVLLAIGFLVLLVREMLILETKPVSSTTGGAEGAEGAEGADSMVVKARKRVMQLYGGGLLSTAIAASILVSMKDWVIIDVKLSAEAEANIEKVSLNNYTSNLDLTIQSPPVRKLFWQNGIRVAVAQKDFDSVKRWDTLFVQVKKGDGSDDKEVYYLQRHSMSQVIMPGSGVFMEGTPTTSKPENSIEPEINTATNPESEP